MKKENGRNNKREGFVVTIRHEKNVEVAAQQRYQQDLRGQG